MPPIASITRRTACPCRSACPDARRGPRRYVEGGHHGRQDEPFSHGGRAGKAPRPDHRDGDSTTTLSRTRHWPTRKSTPTPSSTALSERRRRPAMRWSRRRHRDLPDRFYSRKYASLDALPDGALIGVPNDPSNGGRALKVLEQLGLIAEPRGGHPCHRHRRDGEPPGFDLRELTRASWAAPDDLDAAVVNTDWAAKADLLTPDRRGIGREQSLHELHRHPQRGQGRRLGRPSQQAFQSEP